MHQWQEHGCTAGWCFPSTGNQVNNSIWRLGDTLCDTWVAFDVMCCTSSILNLTAISLDRFIAVTRPIQYAKHKNSSRVRLTLALTWIVSLAVSLPVAVGINYTDRRTQTPWLCTFYNADFLIFSSMASFYIPCVLMILLYWRIFRAIRLRADRKSAAQRTPPPPEVTSSPPAAATAQCLLLRRREEQGRLTRVRTSLCGESPTTELIPVARIAPRRFSLRMSNMADRRQTTTYNSVRLNSDPETVGMSSGHVAGSTSSEDLGDNVTVATTTKRREDDDGGRRRKRLPLGVRMRGAAIFSFAAKTKNKTEREKKATKTLAIVLGVFLFCWVPFFTVNIISAVCIRYDLFGSTSVCNIDPMTFALFVWLGYINSFLNPLIYTIFNVEFRKAFKKVVTQPCRHNIR